MSYTHFKRKQFSVIPENEKKTSVHGIHISPQGRAYPAANNTVNYDIFFICELINSLSVIYGTKFIFMLYSTQKNAAAEATAFVVII